MGFFDHFFDFFKKCARFLCFFDIFIDIVYFAGWIFVDFTDDFCPILHKNAKDVFAWLSHLKSDFFTAFEGDFFVVGLCIFRAAGVGNFL